MAQSSSRQQYIDKYAEAAMEQMRRYGIPASVTLAQGIIESASGQSTLAQTANNHFGVKGTFNGQYVLANDDKPNEKFKKYDSVSQSFEDHSKVLMANRYQKYTASLAHDDYKGWAAAIKKGGYATASNYVSTIVGVIEGNDLHKYDQMVMEQMKKEGKQFGVAQNPLSSPSPSTSVVSNLKSTGMNLPQGQYSMPINRDSFLLVTSPFGNRNDPINKGKVQNHHGIDISAKNEALLATEMNGKVIGVDNRTNTGGGKSVTVEYSREDGSKTQVTYRHMSQIAVAQGDLVNAGQQIGISGNTGTRTTGPHLHMEVVNVSAEGNKQWVNPAAYLAEINAKGNLQKEARYNGTNLFAGYTAGGNNTAVTAQSSAEQKEMSLDNWMKMLMGSEDGLGMDMGSGGLLGTIMQMFMTLFMLSMMKSNKTKEEKFQAATEAVLNRRIDLSSFVPNLKSAEMRIRDNGAAVLVTNDGKNEYSKQLTENQVNQISMIVNSNADDATKQQRMGTFISSFTFSQQASLNYEQISAQQQQSQEQQIQRK